MAQAAYATKNKTLPKTNAAKNATQIDNMSSQATIKMLSGMYDDSKKTAQRIDLDTAMKMRIAKDFGTSAANVRVYENPGLDKIGERGFAQGDTVHLAKSVIGSADEDRVLNHEMGHIVRQSHGVASGSGINLSESLESDADSVQSQSIQAAPTLASESSSQMQGNLATSIGGKIKNKFKTMFNIGGYSDKKNQARAEAANVTASGDSIFGKERAQNRIESILSGERTYIPANVEDTAHFTEAVRAKKRQKSGDPEDKYGQILNTINGDMESYEALQGQQTQTMSDDEKIDHNNRSLRRLNVMRETISANQIPGQRDAEIDALKDKIEVQRAQMLGNMRALPGYGDGLNALRTQLSGIADSATDEEQNKQALNSLKTLEMNTIAFQNQYEGAAEDDAFKSIYDSIEQRYETCYDNIYRNNWSFHRAGREASTQRENRDKFRANDVWSSIKSGKGGLKLDTSFRGNAQDPSAHCNSDAAKEEFRRKQMGNIGRLLSSDTGLELLSRLSKSQTKDTLLQRTNIRSDGTYTGAGAGPRNMITGMAEASESKNDGHFNPRSPTDAQNSSGSYGMGTKAFARVSPIDRDSTTVSYDTSGKRILNPQFLMLGHELTHALHNTRGYNSKFRQMSDQMLADGEKEGVLNQRNKWSNQEEFATMFGTDLDFTGSSDSAVRARGYEQSADLQRHTEMAECLRAVNEQKMRDEFHLSGRDYHKAEAAFPLKKRR